jgi:ASTRA-associated protein 1
MVMSLALFHLGDSLTLITAYENGLATVFQQDDQGSWDLLYRAQSHSQPVLSLDVAPSREYFLTSSADALLVKHPIPQQQEVATVSTQPGTPSAEVVDETPDAGAPKPGPGKGKSLLSAALAAAGPQPAGVGGVPPKKRVVEVQTQPLKILNTKHSGQQSLCIRSDGRIFATAGWDAKVRVYAAKSMRELAVLKWHTVGCYAVAFADLLPSSGEEKGGQDPSSTKVEDAAPRGGTFAQDGEESVDGGQHQNTAVSAASGAVVPTGRTGELTAKERRIKHATEAHWLAAGSKDGKVSLWNIY